MFHVKKCNIKSGFNKSVIVTIRSVALFIRTSMELFPGIQLNVLQSEIVANGKSRLMGNFYGLIL